MSNSIQKWVLDRIIDSIYPSIYLWNNPFKIYEYKVLMSGVRLRPDEVVLDLGCGGGLHVFLLAEVCRKAVGLDVDEKWMIRAAQEMHRLRPGRQVQFVCSPLEKAGFPDSTFDKIFSFSVLEHIPNYQEVLKACRRVLKPGGSIHFSVDWLDGIRNPALIEKHRKDHFVVRYFSPNEMRNLLEAAGFCDIRIEPFLMDRRSVELFSDGINTCFEYSYTGAVKDYLKLKKWEKTPPQTTEKGGIYLHVRASTPR